MIGSPLDGNELNSRKIFKHIVGIEEFQSGKQILANGLVSDEELSSPNKYSSLKKVSGLRDSSVEEDIKKSKSSSKSKKKSKKKLRKKKSILKISPSKKPSDKAFQDTILEAHSGENSVSDKEISDIKELPSNEERKDTNLDSPRSDSSNMDNLKPSMSNKELLIGTSPL